MSDIAIIPARGGSKRVPGKNIIDFQGKPMIAYTIEACIDAGVYSDIYVSTDDEEIAEISVKYGAKVPFLRENAADDFSPVSLAIIDMLKNLNGSYETVSLLMANCPLRRKNEIEDAMLNFKKRKLNFQISAFEYGWMNPWWAFKIGDNNKPVKIFEAENNAFSRSQDLPKLFCPSGLIWIAKTAELLNSETFYGPGFELFPASWRYSVDIDSYDDLEMAKLLYAMNNSSNS